MKGLKTEVKAGAKVHRVANMWLVNFRATVLHAVSNADCFYYSTFVNEMACVVGQTTYAQRASADPAHPY
jgi:hypothetical protein